MPEGARTSLHIVVVSWNVADLLADCLRSLPAACGGLDWSCAVVDNASSDASVATARRIADETGGGRVSVQANTENLGFAKACNQGAAIRPEAAFVLFLNPDTESPPGSLEALVRRAEALPRAGILGPKLVYPDGRPQPSVRRFPGVWDQLLQVLKIAHAFPRLPVLRRYLAEDLDLTKEQSVDQVMGACFLMRRAAFDAIGGFDERYFIWMEEVDVCKAVKEKGWDVVYTPVATVKHHLGQSFAKAFHPRRQKYYATSLVQYFQKWHPGWRTWLLRAATPVGLAAVWAVHLLQRPAVAVFVAAASVEFVSFAVSGSRIANAAAAVTLAAATALAAWKRPEIGLGILLLERIVGSQGGLFRLAGPDAEPGTGIAVRILMFAAFFGAWLARMPMKDVAASIRGFFRERKAYVLLAALVAWAAVRGWSLGHRTFLFSDANAWIDLVLLVPVWQVARSRAEATKATIVPVLAGGVIFLAVQTLAVEYLFSHFFGLPFVDAVYHWLRDARLAEITWAPGNVWRVFFQSHLFVTFGLVAGTAVAWTGERFGRWKWGIAACLSAWLLAMSRSLWLGGAAGAATAFVVLAASRSAVPFRFAAVKRFLAVGVLGFALAVGANLLPLPPVGGSWRDALASRTDLSESAAASRWALLPALNGKIAEHPWLGSGFGSTVTYRSQDPRVVAATGGTYTTSAFEWGWLGLWVKFGILGVAAMGWILVSLGRRVWRVTDDPAFRAVALGGLVAIAVTHAFTPYLDHPLGFAALYLLEGWAAVARRPTES